ncbi:hypothetical protein Ddc_15544 [Ditylenchus destructor]|nr:hypothetical protein Ddc_15544 [Ditylenchus destructor]
MPSTSYLTYLNFYETLFTVIFQLIGIALIAHLLLCSKFKNFGPFVLKGQLSISLHVYLWFHLIMLIISLPYHTYFLLEWYPINPTIQNPYLAYVLGIWPNNYMCLTAVAVLLLALDRYLTLRLSIHYSKAVQRAVIGTGVAVIAIIFVGSTIVFLLEFPLDLVKVAQCEMFPCMVRKYRFFTQSAVKISFSAANLLCSIFFFYQLQKSAIGAGRARLIKNRIVKYTIALEIIFDAGPALISFIFNLIVGATTSQYIGPYVLLFTTLDAAICSVLYSKTLLSRRRTGNIGTWQSTDAAASLFSTVWPSTMARYSTAPPSAGPYIFSAIQTQIMHWIYHLSM